MTPSPTQTRPAPWGYTLAIAVLVLIAVAKPILMDTLDPDCFWHLRVGQQILREGIHPLIDNLSFASIREPWTPYSWLAELGMLGLWNAGGWRAAIAANATMNGAFILLIAACCRELQRTRTECVGSFDTVLATTTASVWSLAYLSFRPATFAIVLLALVAYLILRDRRMGEKTGAVWWSLPLTMLLTNVHLSVILVPLWFATCWAGSAWEWYRDNATHTHADLHRRFRRYGILTTGTVVASLATPMLAGVLQTIGHYRSDDVMVASKVIAEMQPFYTGSWGAASAVLVMLVMAGTALNFRRLRKGELLWLIGMTLFLFRLGRFAPLFAIIAAPVAAVVCPPLSDRVLWKKPIAALLGLVLAVGTWNTLRSFPGPIVTFDQWLNRHAAYASSYPTGAADFVAAKVDPGRGRLINEFNWGGYLEWRLGDHYQALMDGRTQVFSRQFWTEMCLGDANSRRLAIEKADGDIAILPAGRSGLADTLRDMGWRVVWSDRYSQVMLPPGGEARLHDPLSIGRVDQN